MKYKIKDVQEFLLSDDSDTPVISQLIKKYPELSTTGVELVFSKHENSEETGWFIDRVDWSGWEYFTEEEFTHFEEVNDTN